VEWNGESSALLEKLATKNFKEGEHWKIDLQKKIIIFPFPIESANKIYRKHD